MMSNEQQSQAEQDFRKEQQDYNNQKTPQEQPDLCKVEKLETLDI